MRSLLAALVLVVAGAGAVGCGDDDGDDEATPRTLGSGVTIEGPADLEGIDDPELCADIQGAIDPGTAAAPSGVDYGTFADELDDVATRAPESIADHMRTVADTYRQIDEQLGGEPLDPADPDAAAAFQDVLTQPEYLEASSAMSQFLAACTALG